MTAKVKMFNRLYLTERIKITRLRAYVGRLITAEEYKEITGEDYE